jgi:hypothetical protein
MFRIGQKVVCVNDSPPPPGTLIYYSGSVNHELVKGRIYTVTKTGLKHPLDLTSSPCICLAECKSPWGYWQTRFRPLVEKETDISDLKALLNPVQEKENV